MAFKVKGLQIEGAAWELAGLALTDAIKAPLPTVSLSWERRSEDAAAASGLEIMVPLCKLGWSSFVVATRSRLFSPPPGSLPC